MIGWASKRCTTFLFAMSPDALCPSGSAAEAAPVSAIDACVSFSDWGNPLELQNRNLGNRIDVVGIYPNTGAIVRLIGAVLREVNDEWQLQHRHMRTTPMAGVAPSLIDAVPAQSASIADSPGGTQPCRRCQRSGTFLEIFCRNWVKRQTFVLAIFRRSAAGGQHTCHGQQLVVSYPAGRPLSLHRLARSFHASGSCRILGASLRRSQER